MKNGKTNLRAYTLKKYKKILDIRKISFVNSINQQILLLFGLITIVCIFFDFYFQNTNLVIPFLITALVSSITTFLGVPILKKVKLQHVMKQVK